MWKRKSRTVTEEEFDESAKALYRFLTNSEPPDDFIKVENDFFWVVARVALEGAGFSLP